ncbi:MAG: 2,3-bisphosphoglycerate-dependent phosphoglycerate mutase [Gaiellaceae bacterium]|jgi:broad specificity phosphatase PhoE|nr:2,3-bisphosphoglycerate-dependent phosphoglycerate mutase [Gaiellaceae bacterium]
MAEVVLARHGESESSAAGIVGGDSPLTAAGREQALRLGEQLRGFPADICVCSAARRARETAEIALAGRGVHVETLQDLGDVRFGAFDGRPLVEYRDWITTHPPTEAVPGGESRAQTLERFASAFREVLARPEEHLVVIAHGLTIRALLDERPQPVVAGAPYGEAARLTRSELQAAVERLERWCESPSW